MNQFTKKMKIIAALLVLLCTGTMQAQSTFNYLTPYDTITATPDTLHWFVPASTGVAFGTATMTVYYEGDFGASSEDISIMDENGILLGATRPYFDGSDCMADSVTFTFPASLINGWAADDTLRFSGNTSNNVDLFCTSNHARLKLTYEYCSTGPVASLSSSSNAVCSGGGAVALTASPAGGTLTGPGASGSTFDPQGLPSGDYTVTYNYTNAGGCVTHAGVTITILEGPFATALTDTVCPGGVTTLNVTGTGHMVWYGDAGLTMPLDTGFTYITPALSATTTFYAATTLMDTYFALSSFSTADSALIDHDTITGDDRAGIAVTHNYIYVVGDNYTGRYDLDLNNPVQLPRRTALVSDLKTGQLYTLYNPAVGIPDSDSIGAVNVTQLRTLNDDLTLGSGVITLSDTIPFGYDTLGGNDFSGVFAGSGFTVIYSSISKAWYAIDLQDGIVTNLGMLEDPQLYSPEDWATYGVAEYDGSSYAVLYRDNGSASINRRVLPDNAPTVAYAFTDVSDMASFTYAPWNNRLYMHYEGSGEFGGDSETLLYIHANDSTGTGDTGSTHINCAAVITITVDVCTDIKENAAGAMNIYPNPTTGVFTIGVSANMTNSKVEVISLEGRLVYSEMLRSGQTTKEVDLTGLAKGMYYVRISNDTDVITQKLVKY